MREIKYTILPPIGNVETHKHGTVKDLLFDVPYFFFDEDIIPPFAVLNEFLRKGVYDAGMSGGCRWKPFEISENEYAELIEELLTQPDRNLKEMEDPESIKSYKEWIYYKTTLWNNSN